MKNKLLKLIILILMFISWSNIPVLAKQEVSDENMRQSVIAYKKGVQLLKIKNYDDAITSFQKALEYNPKLSDAYYNIAQIYVFKKNYDEAYNNYTKAIAINPRDYDSILQAAKISYNRKNYSLVLKYLNYIPEDYAKYYVVKQLYKDAKEQFELQSAKVERSKISNAIPNKRVIIDKFDSPAGVVVDSEGNIYVSCYSSNSIVKVDKNKAKTDFVKDYLLEGPVGLAIDKYDNIYVANFEANNVLKITKAGTVSIFMDKVSKPYFLYIKDDVLYVSEQGNNVVLTYNLNVTGN